MAMDMGVFVKRYSYGYGLQTGKGYRQLMDHIRTHIISNLILETATSEDWNM